METDIIKIARRCLITIFSIILILVFNAYMDKNYDLQAEKIKKTSKSEKVDKRKINTNPEYWDEYIPFSSDGRFTNIGAEMNPLANRGSGESENVVIQEEGKINFTYK
jgi:hypothetical protein